MVTTELADPRQGFTLALLDSLLVHCGDGIVTADRRALAQALFFHESGGPGLPASPGSGVGRGPEDNDAHVFHTGISEFSLSLRAGCPGTVRVLSEVLSVGPVSASTARLGGQWGTAMLESVARTTHTPFDTVMFGTLYDAVYGGAHPATPPNYRFGIGLQFDPTGPWLKVYFDLHAGAEHRRRETLGRLCQWLDLTLPPQTHAHTDGGFDPASCRIVGVDFGPDRALRAKLYWGARHLSWNDITRWACDLSPDRVETVERLRREVCGTRDALPSVLVSFNTAGGHRGMKIDVALARLYDNDAQALAAVQRFVGPGVDVATPLTLVSRGLRPDQTRCVQQYVSVELAQGIDARTVVYYRPVGLQTRHLNRALWPRLVAS